MNKVRIYDNGGATFDRFTVIYTDEPEGLGMFSARAMSSDPFKGFGQMCTASIGKHLGKRIAFDDLPEPCKRLVMQDKGELMLL